MIFDGKDTICHVLTRYPYQRKKDQVWKYGMHLIFQEAVVSVDEGRQFTEACKQLFPDDEESYVDGIYQANGTATFEKGEAHVLFGLRHSPAGDGRLLAGDIYRARIYDRALTAEEVRASCSGADAVNYVSRAEIDAALPVGQPERCKELESLIADLEAAIAQMSAKGSADPLRPWADLAHSILNLKEFIYLK